MIRILDSWRGDFSDEDFKIWFDKLNEVPLGKEGLLTCGMQYNAFTFMEEDNPLVYRVKKVGIIILDTFLADYALQRVSENTFINGVLITGNQLGITHYAKLEDYYTFGILSTMIADYANDVLDKHNLPCGFVVPWYCTDSAIGILRYLVFGGNPVELFLIEQPFKQPYAMYFPMEIVEQFVMDKSFDYDGLSEWIKTEGVDNYLYSVV